MFADMKSMVTKAWREQYALLAINCMNLESARAAVRVAEKHRAPIILNLYQGHLEHFPAPLSKRWQKKPQYRSRWRWIMERILYAFVRLFAPDSAG